MVVLKPGVYVNLWYLVKLFYSQSLLNFCSDRVLPRAKSSCKSLLIIIDLFLVYYPNALL